MYVKEAFSARSANINAIRYPLYEARNNIPPIQTSALPAIDISAHTCPPVFTAENVKTLPTVHCKDSQNQLLIKANSVIVSTAPNIPWFLFRVDTLVNVNKSRYIFTPTIDINAAILLVLQHHRPRLRLDEKVYKIEDIWGMHIAKIDEAGLAKYEASANKIHSIQLKQQESQDQLAHLTRRLADLAFAGAL